MLGMKGLEFVGTLDNDTVLVLMDNNLVMLRWMEWVELCTI